MDAKVGTATPIAVLVLVGLSFFESNLCINSLHGGSSHCLPTVLSLAFPDMEVTIESTFVPFRGVWQP